MRSKQVIGILLIVSFSFAAAEHEHCTGRPEDDVLSPSPATVEPIVSVPKDAIPDYEKVQCPEFPTEKPETYCVDLSNRKAEDLPPQSGLSWYESQGRPLYDIDDRCCHDRAVIKINPPCWARGLRIDLTAVDSYSWTMNLGDSMTNNGWAGDSGTTHFDAESQVLNGVFRTYTNDYCGSVEHPAFSSYVGPSHSMTLRVTRFGLQRISVPTGTNFQQVCNDKCLYRFDEMYLGMNRVVNVYGPGNRIGGGLCKVCFTWERRSFCSKGFGYY